MIIVLFIYHPLVYRIFEAMVGRIVVLCFIIEEKQINYIVIRECRLSVCDLQNTIVAY